jgi:hypothetical protein
MSIATGVAMNRALPLFCLSLLVGCSDGRANVPPSEPGANNPYDSGSGVQDAATATADAGPADAGPADASGPTTYTPYRMPNGGAPCGNDQDGLTAYCFAGDLCHLATLTSTVNSWCAHGDGSTYSALSTNVGPTCGGFEFTDGLLYCRSAGGLCHNRSCIHKTGDPSAIGSGPACGSTTTGELLYCPNDNDVCELLGCYGADGDPTPTGGGPACGFTTDRQASSFCRGGDTCQDPQLALCKRG